jgi:twitching motility protein PilT
MAQIDALLQLVVAADGSDLHMNEGQPPKVRVHGDIIAVEHPTLTHESLSAYLSEIAGAERWRTFLETGDLDFAYQLGKESRFRVNYYKQLHGFGCVMRLIPSKISTLQELDLPPVIKEFANLRSGLVLVTGPTGSGKSTTLAALIDYINHTYAHQIITLEEPIEFIHEPIKSIITQREVGVDTKSFSDGLLVAKREDPNVILVGEMRDLETISQAVSAAEQGVLVFGTLHTSNASKTVDRIIDAFPVDQQPLIRSMLAASLKGVCAQRLMKRVDGKGRCAVNEILRGSSALSNVIREGATEKIPDIIKLGAQEGMQLMDDSIFERLRAGQVSAHEAYMKALDQKRFMPFLSEDERRAEEIAAEEAAKQVRMARGAQNVSSAASRTAPAAPPKSIPPSQ